MKRGAEVTSTEVTTTSHDNPHNARHFAGGGGCGILGPPLSSSSWEPPPTTTQSMHACDEVGGGGAVDVGVTCTTSLSAVVFSAPKRLRRNDESLECITNDHERLIAKLAAERYLSTFYSEPLSPADKELCSHHLVGRIQHQYRDETSFFPYLTRSDRKLAWVTTGYELVEYIHGKTAHEIAHSLKFDEITMKAIEENKKKLRLFILPKDENIVLCKWDAFIKLVASEEAYTSVIGDRLKIHLDAFESLTFDEIQATNPSIDIIETKMGVSEYLESANSLVEARAFLYHELGLNEYAKLPYADRDHLDVLCYMTRNVEVPKDEWIDIRSN